MFITITGKTYFLPHSTTVEDEVKKLLYTLSLPLGIFTFQAHGKVLTSFEGLPSHTCIKAHIPLVGGKGGYGAKLKTQGGKKVRPNDNMFSRDMSGQRVVYATMEREYREFIAKKTQEDQRVAKQRQQFKVMQNTLKQGHSFMKLDKAYKKEVEEAEKSLNNSIAIGKQKYLEKLKGQQNSLVKQQQQKEDRIEQKGPCSEEQEKLQGAPQEKTLKRNGANLQEEEEGGQTLKKKVKTTVQVTSTNQPAPEPVKPVFSSAQERFKALFKK